MDQFIYNFLLLIMVVSAFVAAFTPNLLASVITLIVFSGCLVVIYVILQAPDVALAEIVISGGITTGLFVVTISKTEGVE
ncbi:Na(+)/H(+) antiporter subunit B [Fuchsiella alkaliacetigena]|uniref:Na(+)/H(+) antiporter subunit B n=1 Tax=Fuchsiella alkaliacetigena TaxID=957042 RepID=UPI00200B920C|nr:hydrogenase subunit MbhD domain-containing protein [Fuchsiella alkaliacetigena]MCK8825634.1 DUF4040 domain-containing protein [Fuchsiella alkaliacetigena]